MSAVPSQIDPAAGPPMVIPLRHFLVGIGFLVLATVVATSATADWLADPGYLGHVHLFLVGWVCVTIMGAMTQFVPVWSGIALHSHRLAAGQLVVVTLGLSLFIGSWMTQAVDLVVLGGICMLAGFWLFVYNLGRTLLRARPWDITEWHFAIALGCFVLLTSLGVGLAAGLSRSVFVGLSVDQGDVKAAHVTLAVLGAIMVTVIGAIYQLATMFTQAKPRRIDRWLQRVEFVTFPAGVLVLATGRLFGRVDIGRLGAIFILTGALAVAVFLARRLLFASVSWTPMLSRYAVATGSLFAWIGISAGPWIDDPLATGVWLGGGGGHLLALGVIGFVVFGSLYHVIPFILWVHRYSDKLGLEDVPMIDDLYSSHLARADFVCLLGGTIGLVMVDLWAATWWVIPSAGLLSVGTGLFGLNMALVVYRHNPSPPSVLFGVPSLRRVEDPIDRPR